MISGKSKILTAIHSGRISRTPGKMTTTSEDTAMLRMMVDFDFNDWYDLISINLNDRRICGEFLGVDYWLENGFEEVMEPIGEL